MKLAGPSSEAQHGYAMACAAHERHAVNDRRHACLKHQAQRERKRARLRRPPVRPRHRPVPRKSPTRIRRRSTCSSSSVSSARSTKIRLRTTTSYRFPPARCCRVPARARAVEARVRRPAERRGGRRAIDTTRGAQAAVQPGGRGTSPIGTPQCGSGSGHQRRDSKSKDASIRLYNGRGHYNEWAFVYTASTQTPGAATGAAAPITPRTERPAWTDRRGRRRWTRQSRQRARRNGPGRGGQAAFRLAEQSWRPRLRPRPRAAALPTPTTGRF